MKHFYLTCLIFLSTSFSLFSQNNQWALPQSFASGKIEFVDSLHGFALGNSFNITIDGGQTWNSNLLDFTVELTGLSFANQLEGWISGHEGLIAHTTDGGQTWNTQTTGTTEDLLSIYFLNNQEGFAGGTSGTVLKTIDGGQTWITLPIAFPNYTNPPNIAEMEFVDNQKGWIIGRGVVGKTTDGGQTWINEVPLGAGSISFSELEVIDFNNVWVAGNSGAIQQTTDGGNSWTNHYDFQMSHIYYGLRFINSQVGWVTGGDSHIRRTLDGGQTWETLSFPSATFLTYGDLHIFNQDRVYLSGGYQLTVESGTLQWDTVVYTSYNFLPSAFDFKDSLTGWAGNNTNNLYKTIDGACTWSKVNTGYSGGLGSICVFGNTIIAGSGSFNPNMTHSKDGGQTWTQQPLPNATYGVDQITLLDANNGYLRADNRIYKTTDGGDTWTFLLISEDFDMYFLDQQNGWVSAFAGSVKKTTDGGSTWSSIYPPNGAQAIYFRNTLEGWAGSNNTVAHTTDGGQTWTLDTLYEKPSFSYTAEINDITFVDAMNGWILGNRNRNFKTNDGGQTWQPINIYVYEQEPIIDAFSPTRYYVGARGIVKYSYDASKQFSTEEYLVCEGESILINGQVYTSGIYTIQDNCDSLQKIRIVETPAPNSPTFTVSSTEISVNESYASYQWYFNGNLINGAINAVHTPVSSGFYHVEISNTTGCMTVSDSVEFIMVNTQNILNQKSVRINPNPTNGRVVIELEMQGKDNAQLSLYNVTGQLLKEVNLEQSDKYRLDLFDYSNGVYFVTIMINDQIVTKKIILNK